MARVTAALEALAALHAARDDLALDVEAWQAEQLTLAVYRVERQVHALLAALVEAERKGAA